MSLTLRFLAAASAFLLAVGCGFCRAGEAVSQADYEKLKKEVEELRQKLAASAPVAEGGAVERVLENKYGPNAGVTTRQGKLTVGMSLLLFRAKMLRISYNV